MEDDPCDKLPFLGINPVNYGAQGYGYREIEKLAIFWKVTGNSQVPCPETALQDIHLYFRRSRLILRMPHRGYELQQLNARQDEHNAFMWQNPARTHPGPRHYRPESVCEGL